jgi:hypothetical protein
VQVFNEALEKFLGDAVAQGTGKRSNFSFAAIANFGRLARGREKGLQLSFLLLKAMDYAGERGEGRHGNNNPFASRVGD